jgi:hypothetical protein
MSRRVVRLTPLAPGIIDNARWAHPAQMTLAVLMRRFSVVDCRISAPATRNRNASNRSLGASLPMML